MLIASIAAAALYLLVAGLRWRQLRLPQANGKNTLMILAVVAIGLHGYAAWNALQTPTGVSLGFFKAPSLIFWIINVAFVVVLARRPLENLLLILFPLAAATVLVAALAPESSSSLAHLDAGMLIHIGSSVLAYAVLTLATCQAAVVALQDYQLRHQHTGGIIRILPPMQLMESMLFEMLWVGLILLTLSIGSGMLFLEDMFAQSLVHKTVLTICAWCVFAILLWGHHRLGWRSQTAVRFTLAGFAALMLGYFGSKLVLEVILQRV